MPTDSNADIVGPFYAREATPEDNFWTIDDVNPYLEIIAGMKMTPSVRQALENVRPNGQRLFSDEQLGDPGFFVWLMTQSPSFLLGRSSALYGWANQYLIGFDWDMIKDMTGDGLTPDNYAVGGAAVFIKEAVEHLYGKALGGCDVNQQRWNVFIAVMEDNGNHPSVDTFIDNVRGWQEVCF